MNPVLTSGEAAVPASSANKRNDSEQIESQVSLQRASRVLRAIRQRYETGRDTHPDARCYSVQVALDDCDLAWITAAIEAVEKTIADRSFEAARLAVRPPKNRRPRLATINRADT